MSPFVGCLSYRLNFASTKNAKIMTNKDTKPVPPGAASAPSESHASLTINRKRPASAMMDVERSAVPSPFAGWTFTPSRSQGECSQDSFFVVVFSSKALLDLAIKSVSEQAFVRIHRYHFESLILPTKGSKQMVLRSIYVHEDGIQLIGTKQTTPMVDPNLLTLSQVAKLDFFVRQTQTKPAPKCSLVGCVRAMTPIITMEPRDPFCLVELIQVTGTTQYSVVIVLTKESLVRWSALYPGCVAKFLETQPKTWRAPQILKNLRPIREPPDRIFWVEQPSQVVAVSAENFDNMLPCHVLEGRILSLEYKRLTRTYETIHVIRLEVTANEMKSSTSASSSMPTNGAEKSVAFLLMTYFPMDISLQSSLRVGTEIQAFSLQCIDPQQAAYAATLRSSILVIRTPSSAPSTFSENKTNIAQSLCVPFCFVPKVKVTHMSFWRQWQCQTWLYRCLRGQELDVKPLAKKLVGIVFADAAESTDPGLRNPYAEFFECAGREIHNEFADPNESEMTNKDKASSCQIPHLEQLKSIREKAFEEASRRLNTLWRGYHNRGERSFFPGWTGSFVLPCPRNGPNGNPVLTGGWLNASTPEHGPTPGGLRVCSDGVCLSVITREKLLVPVKSLSVFEVDAEIVSAICLGYALTQVVTCYDIPAYDDEKGSMTGSSRLLIAGGFLFLCSVTLKADKVTAVPLNHFEADCDFDSCKRVQQQQQEKKIQNCLCFDVEELHGSDQRVQISSMMIRKFFGFCKARHGIYKGLSLTLSHIPIDKQDVVRASLQSIEVRPTVIILDAKRMKMRHILQDVFGEERSEETIDTTTALWKISDDPRSCSILTGGWDELSSLEESGMRALSHGVKICFPGSAVEREKKRGYIRFRCGLSEMCCDFLWTGDGSDSVSMTGDVPFDFVGGNRFFPGMLDRRPSRTGQNPNSKRILGELSEPMNFPNSGIPRSSLGYFEDALCRDLQMQSRRHLKPSLLHEIRCGRFLGISLCRAYAECTKCFQKLSWPKKHNQKTHSNISYEKSLEKVKQRGDPAASATFLVCRNGCEAANYAIQWECFGVLEDGCDRGVLYAERDVAVTLLGLDRSTLEAIEDGLWNMDEGLRFSPGVPLQAHVREAVRASVAAANQKGDEEKLLACMKVNFRAEYLFQVHCQTSVRPMRPLVYYVRCRPVSDDMISVAQAKRATVLEEENTSKENGVVVARKKSYRTYTLPEMKLDLVDMAAPDS